MSFQISIILAMVFVVGLFAYIMHNSEEESIFSRIFNYLFSIGVFVMFIITLGTANALALDAGFSGAAQTTIRTSYIVGIWLSILSMVYLTINLAISIINYKKEMDEEEDE